MDLNDARDLAHTLMETHLGSSSGWTFGFDRAENRFGLCQFRPKFRITISAPLTIVNTERRVASTVLHEIAHALAGPNENHGPKWQHISRSIGGPSTRLVDANGLPPKFIGTCINGHTSLRNRREDVACGRCCKQFNGGKYDAVYRMVWTVNPAREDINRMVVLAQ
jgi:predicted SprT family Zn-dependent metalloprotease